MASGFAGLKSQPEFSAGYPRRMDSQWGVGVVARGADMAIQFNERTVSTCEVVALTWPFNPMKEQ